MELLGIRGENDCAPTSVANLFADATNHRDPDADPGLGDRDGTDHDFDGAGKSILRIGEEMNTDPETGTKGPRFAGMPAGRDFTADRSSTNSDAAIHTPKDGWYERLPEREPEVRLDDLDGDQQVNRGDLAIVLAK